MEDVMQIYIDRLAQSNHNCIMLEAENRNLKEKIKKLEELDNLDNKEEIKEFKKD